MKILIANDGFHAHFFERKAWVNALNTCDGIEAVLYNINNSVPFDVFNKFEPDLYIGQLYNINSATLKCILKRPNLKVALRAGEFNKLPENERILRVSDQELDICNKLLSETGKPDFIYTHYLQNDIEKTHIGFSEMGIKLIGIPMSADVHTYLHSQKMPELECDIGFVGGYWPYKGQIIDKYLTPLCRGHHVKIFGNQLWPHVNQYCGMIEDDMVANLFASAKICPNLSEPHAQELGVDLNERAFKVLCAGGFCIMDNVRAARDIFGENLTFADNPTHFKELVDYYLTNEKERVKLARKGRNFVLSNHTNFHRAELFLRSFNENKMADKIRKTGIDYINYFQQRQSATA